MKRFFQSIQRAGAQQISDPLAYRRVLFINSVSLACVVMCTFITILVVLEGLFPQNLMIAAAGMLFMVPIFLNHNRQYLIARVFYLLFSVSIVVAVSWVAFQQQRMNEPENVLIAFMAAAYLLFDGRLRYVSYVTIFGVLIGMKFLRQIHSGGEFGLDFYLMLQNNAIICILIFLFANSFRTSLMGSLEQLKAKDNELFSMIDNIPLFIGLIDAERRYLMVNINYQRAFGMDRNEIIGSRVDEVLPDNILKVHLPMVKAALEGESPDFLQHTLMPDGSSFYASGKYIPIKDPEGKVVAASVFVSDVTTLEEAKNKLRDANHTKDRLFSIIAHDIRGPLDMFQTLLSVSSEGVLTQEQFMEHQQTVRNRLDGLRGTVDTLLDWARTQLDGIQASPEVVNIKNVLIENKELFEQLLIQKQIIFSEKVEDDLEVWIDKNHFKVIIRNMLHNAIKFSPIKGEIEVVAQQVDGYVSLSIVDHGIGMDEDQVASIIDMQVQESKSGTAGEGGTGLGLSLSMGLLEKNRCEVDIDSAPNQGTTIRLRIPAVE